MISRKLLGVLSVGSLILSSMALSEEILVLNSNYESDIVPHDPGYTTFISGWVNSGYGSIGVDLPKAGVDYVDVNNHGQVAYIKEGGRISQTVGTTLLAGETYTLDYEIGRPLGQTGHHFIARFKAYGLVMAQNQSDLSTVAEGEWASQTLTFTATEDMPVGKPLVVEFYNLSSNAGHNVNLDNVTLNIAGTGVETPVEEEKAVTIASVMQGDATLNIPEDFANINAALASLDDKVIKKDSIVTIQVNNCAVNDPNTTVRMTHPQGANIHIIGNPLDPSACVLQFNGVNGFQAGGSDIGLIDGFHIQGDDTGGTYGIRSQYGAIVNVGSNVWVSDFNFGFSVNLKGQLFANNTSAYSNTNSGYVSEIGGFLRADDAESYWNGQEGYEAWNSGVLYARNSQAYSNGRRGYMAHANSYVYADGAKSQDNYDYSPGFGSHHFSAMHNRNSVSSGHYYARANDADTHSFMNRGGQNAYGNDTNRNRNYVNFGSVMH